MQTSRASIPEDLGQSATTRAGDIVRIRSQRWHVLEVQSFERCQLITVRGIGAENAALTRQFLLPFETVGALNQRPSLRFVSPRLWRRGFRTVLATHTPPGSLCAAGPARIDLMAHQLEPALAVTRGLGTRVLLADDVGLGKTIQAGLIISELETRGVAERVLILTPAGLREQWAGELFTRFGINATVVDFRDVRQRVTSLPLGLNPWSTVRHVIASIDYVKRPEILKSVLTCRWDILVVDEAHGAANDSARHAAVEALASRVPYVLLLTATPHNGDEAAFRSLCRTGQHGDPILIFRRRRTDVMLSARRRVHRVQVQPSGAESHMHRLLSEFTRTVWLEHRSPDAWLSLSVLHKRALSSAQSLQLSINRRLETLAAECDPETVQLLLPLIDANGELDAADEPPSWTGRWALRDKSLERRLLEGLAASATLAAVAESKLSVVRRLVRRISEPLLIFTEYRDTLMHLQRQLDLPVSILHGGLTRDERTAALDDFIEGRYRILLATDAASEGLNLHSKCRVVINLELPWNPMRLEQRIGRIDRIGQSRTVHVFHLISKGTGEERILDRLKRRVQQARQDIAAADPMAFDERELAGLVIGPESGEGPQLPSVEPPSERLTADRVIVDVRSDALVETRRLTWTRNLSPGNGGKVYASVEGNNTWVARARLRSTRLRLGSRIVAVFSVEDEEQERRVTNPILVPFAVALRGHSRFGHSWIRAFIQEAGRDLRLQAQEVADPQRRDAETLARTFLETRTAREAAIVEVIAANQQRAPIQAGLFDRRTEYEHLTARADSEQAVAEAARHLARWRRQAAATGTTRVRLLLMLVP
jgi:superfamily II DNA or RNA helicase